MPELEKDPRTCYSTLHEQAQREAFLNSQSDGLKQEDFDAAKRLVEDRHVMVDIETWGTGSYAAIISIGAVKFAEDKWEDRRFHVAINPTSSMRAGLRPDADTIQWWMSPDCREALDKWLLAPKVDLAEALQAFSQWFGPESLPTWGNGATFDNVILRNAFQLIGEPCPWAYKHDRCFRTLKNLFGSVVPEPKREGTTHDALDDAMHQANWLREMRQYVFHAPFNGLKL